MEPHIGRTASDIINFEYETLDLADEAVGGNMGLLRPDDYVVLSYYQLSHHNLLCPVYSFTTSRLPQH